MCEEALELDQEQSLRPAIDLAPHQGLIAATVEALRPVAQRDGGDLELVRVEGDRVFIRLKGACTTCAHAGHTLGGVRRELMQQLGVPLRVVPAAG